MTNTPHNLEPGWHSQVNKAAAIFGSTGNETGIGIFGFVWATPAAGTSNSGSTKVVERATNDGNTFGAGGLSAKSITWTPVLGTATIPAGAFVTGTRS